MTLGRSPFGLRGESTGPIGLKLLGEGTLRVLARFSSIPAFTVLFLLKMRYIKNTIKGVSSEYSYEAISSLRCGCGWEFLEIFNGVGFWLIFSSHNAQHGTDTVIILYGVASNC